MANLFAGMGSHQSARSQTSVWLTPPEIIQELGPFDLDPCAAPDWKTAIQHYYERDNGLRQRWHGRVWLNPPYDVAQIRSWMMRMMEHNQGTALVFARTETRWFFESVWNHARAMLFVEGRINFYKPDGRRSGQNAGAPSVLIAYGDEDTARLSDSDLRGAFVLLHNQHWAVIAIPKTWEEVVAGAFDQDTELTLAQLYDRLDGHPKAENNNNWQAKIRQIVQLSDRFRRLRPGLYELQRHPDKENRT